MQRKYENFFVPFPVLETDRLRLRRIRRSDTFDIYQYSKKQSVCKYTEWLPHTDIKQTRSFVRQTIKAYRKHEGMVWGIELKENGRLIGTCGFTVVDPTFLIAEIGYCLSDMYWRRGLGAEAVGCVVAFGFEVMKLLRIEVRMMVDNKASSALAEKLGFSFEGLNKKSMYFKGGAHDILRYGMTDDQYLEFLKQG
ncbi:MAG: GNAT family protein [bacterium]|nr:GNAT family protein [bacterium]